MTTTTAAPLPSLAQQIGRQQAELEALQREYEARQSTLAELNRQRAEVKAQLQQVNADIRAATEGSPPTAGPSKKGNKAKPAAPLTETRAQTRIAPPVRQPATPRTHSLPGLLLEIVQQATGPLTVKQLVREVVRRKFPTTSRNLAAMVETRAHELVRKGLLQRASGQPGFVPASSTPKLSAAATPQANTKNGAVVSKKASSARTNGQQLPLRVVLTNILAKSRRPLAARELADQVLVSGYQTKSKNFIDVLWVALPQMKNVQRVPDKGYILKR
jgi:hypothetical protein